MHEQILPSEQKTTNDHTTLIFELRKLATDTAAFGASSPYAEIHAAALNLAAEYIEKKTDENSTDPSNTNTHLLDQEYLDAVAATLVHMATDEHAIIDEAISEKLVATAGILSPPITEECI